MRKVYLLSSLYILFFKERNADKQYRCHLKLDSFFGLLFDICFSKTKICFRKLCHFSCLGEMPDLRFPPPILVVVGAMLKGNASLSPDTLHLAAMCIIYHNNYNCLPKQ